MSYVNEIRNFLEDYALEYAEDSKTDIWLDLKITGDDFHEMMENYSKEYGVNMDEYLWYFHTDEEGSNIGSLFSKPPNKRVERIPVTPQMLADFVLTKKWNIKYPVHHIPKFRIDLFINLIIFLIFLGLIIIWFLN